MGTLHSINVSNGSVPKIARSSAAVRAVKSLKTTALMSIEESMQAMKKASSVAYRPPS
jgi:hypothetical protein